MATEYWAALLRACISTLGPRQAGESSETHALSESASAEHCSGELPVRTGKLSCLPPCPSVSITGAPSTIDRQHLQRPKSQAHVPNLSASDTFDPQLKHQCSLFPQVILTFPSPTNSHMASKDKALCIILVLEMACETLSEVLKFLYSLGPKYPKRDV